MINLFAPHSGAFGCFSWAVECAHEIHGLHCPVDLLDRASVVVHEHRAGPMLYDMGDLGVELEFWFSKVPAKLDAIHSGDLCRKGFQFGFVYGNLVLRQTRNTIRYNSIQSAIRAGWSFYRPHP